jgi:hypothetical protein
MDFVLNYFHLPFAGQLNIAIKTRPKENVPVVTILLFHIPFAYLNRSGTFLYASAKGYCPMEF